MNKNAMFAAAALFAAGAAVEAATVSYTNGEGVTSESDITDL